MRTWTCIACGRMMRVLDDTKPTHCYFDNNTYLQEMEERDEILAGTLGIKFTPVGMGLYVEFPGDIRFNPFTGIPMHWNGGKTLEIYQSEVMKRVPV